MKKSKDITQLVNKRVRAYDTNRGVIHYGIVSSVDKRYNEVKIIGDEGSPNKFCVNVKYVEEV